MQNCANRSNSATVCVWTLHAGYYSTGRWGGACGRCTLFSLLRVPTRALTLILIQPIVLVYSTDRGCRITADARVDEPVLEGLAVDDRGGRVVPDVEPARNTAAVTTRCRTVAVSVWKPRGLLL